MVMLLAVIVFGGYLFPLAGAIMSWREWLATKSASPQTVWRRTTTLVALLLLTAAMPLWAYAVVREFRGDYSYDFASAQVGRWSSPALLVFSGFSENKVRIYWLLGAVGLLFFYGGSIGELP
jgi:hypothetical protein